MTRYRSKIVGAVLITCAVIGLGWSVVSARRDAASDQANHLAELGVVLQRPRPWQVEQINRWPSDIPPSELRALQSFSGIKLLNLQRATIADADLAYLTELPKLETLLLGQTQITDRGLVTIAKIPTLKMLSLEHADVTKVGVRELKQLRPDLSIEVYEASLVGLEHLKPYLPHATLDEDYELVALDLLASDVTDDDLQPLMQCERLRILNLSETSVGDPGIAHLASLSNLEELWLRDTEVTDAGLAVIGRLTKLRALSLADTTVSDEGVEHLKSLTQLEILHLGSTEVSDAALRLLQDMASLKELYLSNSRATQEGTNALMSALPNTKVIADPASLQRAEDIESKVLG